MRIEPVPGTAMALRKIAQSVARREALDPALTAAASTELPDWSERAAEGDPVSVVYIIEISFEALRESMEAGDDAFSELSGSTRQALMEGGLSEVAQEEVAAAWALSVAESVGQWGGVLWEYVWPGDQRLFVLQRLSFDDWGDYQVVDVEFSETREGLLGLRHSPEAGQCYYLADG